MRKLTYYLLMLFSIVTMVVSTVFCIQSITYAPDYLPVNENTLLAIEKDNYYRKDKFEPFEYEKFNHEKDYINNYDDLYENSEGATYKTFKKGDDGLYHLLVLPVTFKDSRKDLSLEQKHINIHNAFFGSTNSNTSYSVSEYYNISSYGHVKLTGEVAPFLELPLTFDEVKQLNGQGQFVSRYITDLCVNNYFDSHPIIDDDSSSRYDFNHDGFVDGVFVIYDYDYEDTESLNWAYVDDCPINYSVKINENLIRLNHKSPYFKLYGWASYEFMETDIYNQVNSHVYIHEVGHLLGLDDYYSDNTIQPLGYLDMMDINIGDHNPFSKYILGWTSPYVVKNVGDITIKPFSTDGEFILIPGGNFNDNPFSEYFLLEYYAPLGVNFYDTQLNFVYGNKNQYQGSLITDYGIKVYHVDSSLGYVEKKLSDSFFTAADDPMLEDNLEVQREVAIADPQNHIKSWCVKIMSSNKKLSNHPLIRIVERPGVNNVYPYGLCASNDSLLKVGDTIDSKNLPEYRFYNSYGKSKYLPFNFTIKHMDSNGATISFTR